MYFQVIRGDINVNKSIIHEYVLNLDTTRDGLCGADGEVVTKSVAWAQSDVLQGPK